MYLQLFWSTVFDWGKLIPLTKQESSGVQKEEPKVEEKKVEEKNVEEKKVEEQKAEKKKEMEEKKDTEVR